jgi:hypothetical protein
MPMDMCLGMMSALRRIFEEESKARKEAEEAQTAGMSMPSMPSSYSSMMNAAMNMPH